MTEQESNDPLHGITLEALLEELVERYGWDGLAKRVRVRCFQNDPSLKSSLKFLRKTDWARTKVERLYLSHLPSRRRTGPRHSERTPPRRPGGGRASSDP